MIRLLRFILQHPLNRSNRLGALTRLFCWQIAARLLRGPIALPFVDGTFLFASKGMSAATGNWYCGLYEVVEMAFALHLLRKDDHFLDIGANIGSYTILAAGGVGARVTSVEPIPQTMANLKRNVDLNGLGDRATCVGKGLSNVVGVLHFSDSLDAMNHILEPGSREVGIQVPVTTVDQLVNDDVPVLIKLDVEGHEVAVLQGAQRVLSDPRLLAAIIETKGNGGRYGCSDDDVAKIMEGYGFERSWYDPFSRTLTAPDATQENTIFVRNREEIQRRVKSAQKHTLVNGSI